MPDNAPGSDPRRALRASTRGIPRIMPAGRFPTGAANEALERDIYADPNVASDNPNEYRFDFGQGSLTLIAGTLTLSGLAALSLCGPVVLTDDGGGNATLEIATPIYTLVLIAEIGGTSEQVGNTNCPFDVGMFDEYRYVIHQINTNGNDYRAQYHDGSAWVDAGTQYSTGGVRDRSYVSDWAAVPPAWKALGDALVRIKEQNADANCDTNYAALQFRRSCAVCSVLDTLPGCGTVTATLDALTTLP